jgi:cell division septation protein DedD
MASRGNRGGGGDRVLESRHVIGLFLLMLVFSGVFFALGYVMGRNQYDGQVRAESTPRATPDPVFAAKSDLAGRRPKNSQSAATSTSSAANSGASANSGWGSVSTSTPSATPSARDSVSTPNASPDDSNAPTSDWSFFNSAKNAPDDRLKPAPAAQSSSTISPNLAPGGVAAAGKNSKTPSVSPKTAVPVTSPVPAGAYVLQVAAMRQSVDANAVATSLKTKRFPAFVVNPTTDKYYHVQVGPYHDLKSADAAKKGLESAGFKAIVKH